MDKYYIVLKTRDLATSEEVAQVRGVERQRPLTRELLIADLVEADDSAYDEICDCPHVISVSEDRPITIPEPIVSTLTEEPFINEGIKLHEVEPAWCLGFRGQGVRVGVLDTGLDATHQRRTFGERVRRVKDFTHDSDTADQNGHGTHVAGTVAAPDGIGVAPEAELVIGKVLDARGSGWTSWIMAGIEWAVTQQCQVLNLSLGGLPCGPDDPLVELLERARDRGVIPVAAAGNDGCRVGGEADGSSPGCSPDAITVGALDRELVPARFSSCGDAVDIAAFGENVMSLWLNGTTRTISGTSMACPQVAGGIACLLSAYPRAQDVRRAMYAGAERIRHEPVHVGIGSLNVFTSVRRLIVKADGY